MSAAEAQTPLPNTPAPDFTLPNGDGEHITLSSFRGKNVVLAFYPADWSDVCSNQLAMYQQVIDEIRALDAEVIAVSVDGQESHKAWVMQQGLSFPVLSDFWPHGAVAAQYGVFWSSHGIANRALFFIDREGMLRDVWQGEHPGIMPGLDVVFDALRGLQEAERERQGVDA